MQHYFLDTKIREAKEKSKTSLERGSADYLPAIIVGSRKLVLNWRTNVRIQRRKILAVKCMVTKIGW